MEKKRSKAAEIFIPPVVNPERRAACLADTPLLLKTYFGDRFYNPWAEHHLAMIHAVEYVAEHGGDQAIAAPRGDGKTEVTAAMIVAAILKGLTRFPVIVASTGKFAEAIFKDIKGHFEHNDLLCEDFPEICVPIRNLDGAPQRANKQHIGGVKTRIEWKQEYCIFPRVPGSKYGGVCLAFKGLDSAIRGIKYRGQRPDFVLIDDPETKESAKSDEQIRDREQAIDRDIAGLAAPNKRLARVMLTTIQNRKCLSYKYTDPKIKPSWNGKRFGALLSWPTNRELWDEYMALRQQDQSKGDQKTTAANQFYLDNRDAMDAGAKVSNPYRVSPGEHSAVQAFFNRVTDWGLHAAMAELQNDPIDEDLTEKMGLTAGLVQRRRNSHKQGERPQETEKIFVGIDIGKYFSHWAMVGMHGNAVSHILDYGVMETPGMTKAETPKAVMDALLPALLAWKHSITASHNIDFALVDSGDYTDAVYEFIRQVNGPFAASKGWGDGRYRAKQTSDSVRLFHECHAARQDAERLWLYHVNTDYWKQRVHEGFLMQPRDDEQRWNAGSITLFSAEGDTAERLDLRRHQSFSHHIVAEEYRTIYLNGKERRKWVVVNKNNHWLDATALALCAGGVMGMRVVPRVSIQQATEKRATVQEAARPRMTNQFGQSFVATERR